MKLYQKLKLLREEKGITQNELANTLGIGIQSIRNYESETENRIPNTVQLKLLKDFYNVTYEYLLDDECENKTNESVDIGKKLKLSDDALKKIIELQYINMNIPEEHRHSIVEDKESPTTFSHWLETANISEFVTVVKEYGTLNNILEVLQYFSNISSLNNYIYNSLKNNLSLDNLFKILDLKNKELEKLISHSIFTTLTENDIKELKGEIKKFKDFCSAKHSSITIKEINNAISFIEGIGQECVCSTQRSIKYCLFEATDIIKNDLENNYNKNLSIPSEYKNILKKEGK